jgi:hypothetical protein
MLKPKGKWNKQTSHLLAIAFSVLRTMEQRLLKLGIYRGILSQILNGFHKSQLFKQVLLSWGDQIKLFHDGSNVSVWRH